jgi:predicted methyltransferase
MAVLQFDEEAAKKLLANYLTPDVAQQRSEFLNYINLTGNEIVLDVGSGPGFLARSIANRVGPKGKVWGSHATDPFLPRTLASKMNDSGFQVKMVKVIPLLNPIFDSNTYSNKLIDLIVPFVVNNGGVTQEYAESWAEELRAQKDYFFSLNRYLFIGVKL